jgi:hypothetical protein|tara:strand:+ start:7436 stop:7573 length:138 start_codon:yes stop_codon:yes gene_type:complete
MYFNKIKLKYIMKKESNIIFYLIMRETNDLSKFRNKIVILNRPDL